MSGTIVSLLSATLVVGIVSGAETPLCALRFGFRFAQPDQWPEMRAALEKNRGAFDEIWFSTGVAFPKLAWHEEHARQCAAAAADLRKLGIVPSIEIQTIIGHSDAILGEGDCSGQDWGTMVSCDGLAAKHLSCPRDPKLLAYFTRVAELHAAWHPGSVWLDDDMSYRNRAPTLKSGSGLPGCFCDGCIAAFSKADGRAWTREALVKALRGRTPDDKNASARWNDWSRAVMGTLAQTIAEAVHRVSPETVLGYQFGGLCQEVARGLFAGGGRPIRLRPGGGAYWDTDPHQQLDKAYMTQHAAVKARRESWVAAFAPEIESCPRTFASRTAQGILLEAFENLALGTDFVSMFVADTRGGESVGFFADRLFPRLQAAHPFLASYRAANAGTLSCGFSLTRPTKLVACRGVPIAGTEGPGVRSLGPLPAVRSIPVRKNGSSWLGSSLYSPDGYTMQIVSSVALTNYYAQCDAACGGRMPVVFDEAVMAFVLPRVREDGTLATVAVVNASIDRQDPVSVRLRGVPEGVRCAVWHAPEEKDMELPLARRDGETRVTLPRLGAWQCGYLSVAGH